MTFVAFGDSITGRGPNSYLRVAEQELNTKLKTPAEIINLAQPNQRSHDVLELLQTSLTSYRPDAVILMVGQSDSPKDIKKENATTSDFIFKSNLFSLTKHHLNDLVKKYNINNNQGLFSIIKKLYKFHLISLEILPDQMLLNYFWSVYSQDKNQDSACVDAGKALIHSAYHKAYDRFYFALRDCFVLSGQKNEGLIYFKSLHESHPEVVELELVISELNGHRRPQGLAESSSQSNKMSKRLSIFELYKKTNEFKEQGFDLLKGYFKTEPLPRYEITKFRINKIVKILSDYDVKLILMQYPNSVVDELKNTLNENKYVFLFDTNAALISASKHDPDELLSYFQEDLNHLTVKGHTVIGKSLANFINGTEGLNGQ